MSALVRSCACFDVFHGDLLQCTMEMAAVRIAQVATTRWVCMGQQITQRSDALLTFLRACGSLRATNLIIDHRLEGACWRQRRRQRRYRRACGGVAGRSTSLYGHPTKIHYCDTRLANDNTHPTLVCLFILPALLISFDHKMLQIATHALQIVTCIISQRLTTHQPSSQPGVISISLALKSCLFYWVCSHLLLLARFCSRFFESRLEALCARIFSFRFVNIGFCF